jgi:hypothetical protein
VYTGITAAGHDVLRAALPVYERALRESFDRLAADPRLRPLVRRIRH